MILLQECIGYDFTIGMHWKLFYYRIAFEITLLKLQIHMKGFHYKNALEIIL